MSEETSPRLTHVTEGGHARMVDVSAKPISLREARARGSVRMRVETLAMIRDNAARKGDVLGVARIAGIMAAKRTSELIPLCHGLPLTGVDLEFELDDTASRVVITSGARVEARTGVEMEALTAVSVAALTIYDMCKAVDREMTIGEIELVYKSGGRSGTFSRESGVRSRE
jgi:cyclic pyranopterin phosphate synthase